MLIAVNSISQINNQLNSNKNHSKLNNSVSKPICDTVSFKAAPIKAKQAFKFLIPMVVSSIGLMQYMPNYVVKKLFDIELEDTEHELYRMYGTSNKQKIESHVSNISDIASQNPQKIKIIEKLLRNYVFNSLGNTNYLAQNNPELLDKQLEFLNRMADEKKYKSHACASSLYNHKTDKFYTKEDFDAKNKVIDYLLDFNDRYEKSERWEEDKSNIDVWTIGYKQVDIINSINALNLDLMMEMIKSKTTFIDNICPKGEIQAHDLHTIGLNINEKNIDYVRKMFRDKNVSRDAIAGLSEWIEKNSMSDYKKLNKNQNIPKKYVGDIGAIINDFNYDFIMNLAQNKNVPKEDIAHIGKFYTEYSAPTLKYLIKHIKDNRIMYGKNDIWVIGSRINPKNKEYVEKLCKNIKIPLGKVSDIANTLNEDNFNLVEQMCMDNKTDMKYIRNCAYKVTKKNKQFAEKLYAQYEITNKELADILDSLYALEKLQIKNLNFATKFAILNIQSKYGDLMKECGMDYEDKISKIANSINNKQSHIKPKNLKEFFLKILANNNPEAENVLKTYDFTQFGKNGIPLKYSRKDFIENLEENILSGVKAEDRRTILDNFGIVDNDDYDGLWNNQKLDKLKLISEKGRIAYEKVKNEIEQFILNNEVVSDDSELNQVLNGLIQGIPSFIPTIGKIQHGTHDYSVDIHALKVLQSCLNNPLYQRLSDKGKVIIKISALLHDIGKQGLVRDSGHAEKSAEYAQIILNDIKLPKNEKRRIINIIKNHHWFADYNMEAVTSNNIAARCRYNEDFLIYRILAKADLENVSDDFHLKVTDTKNQKEYNKLFDEKIKKIDEAMDKIRQNANIIFHTKILNNGNKFPIQKVKLKNGKELNLRVLNFNDMPQGTDLEQYGFPRGTTKENARFLVHMTKTGTNFDVASALIESHQKDTSWSTSLINAQNNGTYGDMIYGFIFDVNQENISEAHYKNIGSGCHKNLEDFEEILFDFKPQERTYVRNNLQKKLKMHGIWLSDKEYGVLADYLEKKKHITAIKENVKIGYKTISAKTLVKCLEKSRDSLFKESSRYEHNEVVVINPIIQGLVAKYPSIEDCNEDFLTFADKHQLPIILI